MYKTLKNIIDRVLAVVGLVVLFPVFLLLVLAIKLDSRGPVLFKQKRVGIHKQHFQILKFRTMRIDTPKDTPTHLLENPEQYITKVGRFLRKTSLDELPQIINIIKGDMAIVGPRPALWNQYDLIAERDKYGANDVLPGLTGWAQINGRDELPIDVKAKLDGEYVARMSFWMDLKCIFGTVLSVARQDGVVEGGTGALEKKQRPHILVISQYFYPEEFRINDICREWVKRGYKVTVVTGIPNYPQGRFFNGYGWFRKRKEEHEGIRILRLPIIPRGNNSLMLILNYISFVISGYFWKAFTEVRADKVFIFEVSPMTQALAGVWYAKRLKIPCCIYVQDLWPENVEAILGIRNPLIIGMINKMADYIYRNCGVILTTSPSFVRRIEERPSALADGGVSKVKYWPQYAEEFYKPAEKKPLENLPEDGVFKIVFTGNIGYAQGLSILPAAAERLKEKKISCQFVIIGDGRYRPELEKVLKDKGVSDMFRMLGRKAPEEIPQYLAHCDIAFVSFADNQLFSMTIPAKLQSYMACGKPILAVAAGETKRIIEEAECGWVVPFGEDELLADVICGIVRCDRKALSQMGQNALAYYGKNFDKEQLLDDLESII